MVDALDQQEAGEMADRRRDDAGGECPARQEQQAEQFQRLDDGEGNRQRDQRAIGRQLPDRLLAARHQPE